MPQNKQRKKMIRLSTIAILLFFLTPAQINAWWPFGPSNSDDCILKYQKEAKCERASILINIACKCKFDPENCASNRVNRSMLMDAGFSDTEINAYFSKNKSSPVWDCILDNIGNAQNDQAAVAISTSCISKYNK